MSAEPQGHRNTSPMTAPLEKVHGDGKGMAVDDLQRTVTVQNGDVIEESGAKKNSDAIRFYINRVLHRLQSGTI